MQMPPIQLVLLGLSLLVACSSADDRANTSRAESTVRGDSAAPRDSSSAVASTAALTSEGWGPLRIGMTRAQVVAAAGPDANPEAYDADPAACEQFRPTSAPQGLLVMVEKDTLTRITMSRSRAVKSDAGFAVGDSGTVVERFYGARAKSWPHKYQEAPARYITIWTRGQPPASTARGIVYEVAGDGKVSHIHAGGPSIQYVEGCS